MCIRDSAKNDKRKHTPMATLLLVEEIEKKIRATKRRQIMNALTADLIKLYKKHKPSYSEIIESNKLARKALEVTRPKSKPVRPKAVPVSDVKKFMAVVAAASPKDKLMMNIYLFMGLRNIELTRICLLYTSPSPRDRQKSRMPSSA
eukprot:TRINITY_DN17037_c0_g1_i2.p1 TRINITY_DN17037_c0_g1~~TRINITY_DN17037_c0_g1_i2.p1  ORF type:complete len:156 (-),score=17.26 TRINITY_DN17037_c0_g1_i2:15-455(-)